MKKIAAILLLTPLLSLADALPNPILTPGEINPKITQSNIHKTICISGFTGTIRPPVSYTNKLKAEQINQYGYADKNMSHYEEDHLIPLSVGGHPSSPKNLWPEAYAGAEGARKKDVLEGYMHRAVCDGKISLKDAQYIFAHDWVSVYHQVIK